jgi:hypothetical protein
MSCRPGAQRGVERTRRTRSGSVSSQQTNGESRWERHIGCEWTVLWSGRAGHSYDCDEFRVGSCIDTSPFGKVEIKKWFGGNMIDVDERLNILYSEVFMLHPGFRIGDVHAVARSRTKFELGYKRQGYQITRYLQGWV